jgi:hypothetical protein
MGGDEMFEVEAILDHKKSRNGSISYLLKWKGWPEEESTWEEESTLESCKELLTEYLAAHGDARKGAASPSTKSKKKGGKSLANANGKRLEILAACQIDNAKIAFIVNTENNGTVVSNQKLKRECPEELIRFYEKNCTVFTQLKGAQLSGLRTVE